MALTMRPVSGRELPQGASHGFQLLDGDEAVMFFYWSDDDVPDSDYTHATYANVLAAIPDRLAEMGFDGQTDAILGEVVGLYGAGEKGGKRG